ncbi:MULTISPECIES: aminotransferase class IV [unclassified Mycobacterium]|uniref:aminotransferase class IV n=1 Tax=unclassified Mycobacterium TaxID=2642494 RepID=UPI00068DB612|nr:MULTISPECIES: aminotransferase class IV [unclassified Mycobacterium]SEB21868.1 4-amino-4-deoxychorismate lyase [Mycobacterium sp. 283mftsu]
MTTPPPIVVAVDGCRATVRADDPVFSRGDGVFETALVRGGVVLLLDEHLARLAGSAVLAGLPCPHSERWRAAVASAVGQWPGGEAVLRLVLGRGADGVVAFVMVSAVPARVAAARRDGVAAVTLVRPHWPLAAAKSLSYAANVAALRHAERAGAGDAVFVDATGAVLEGPRSAVVLAVRGAAGEPVLVTPDASSILPSTTQRALFAAAAAQGVECVYRRVTVPDLFAAQGVWLLSAITLAARVHTLDERALPGSPFEALIRGLIDGQI